ncbi:hypothetical protein [Rhodoferax saidenbachensis]|uniref:Membrane protein YgcG n=1 Tax=Rhodoferax saidenbachensis TaxID=1484693 RepID=A0ABU1ZTD3_9BURK|nr:hypothetical protein [Rhodoferax saidenbachensis]MDR7308095.1 putative membrane protein YgcG [Rhodoferax saidenbachensis]
MKNILRAPRMLTTLCMGLGLAAAALAQTAPTPPAPTAPIATAPRPASDKLVGDYTVWAGSRPNAEALVLGLRNGSSVTLGAAASGTTFTPSTTTKLGTGEVNIALSLAKTSLAQQGITQPTPAQIAAALNGGTVTTAKGTQTLPGVLAQRQSGMGWGQIAHAMGVKLGSVVSASKSGKGTTGTQYAKAKLHDKAGSAGTHGKGEHGGGGSSGGGGGGGGGGGKK